MIDFLIKGAIIAFGFVPLGFLVVAFVLLVIWEQTNEEQEQADER